MKWMTPFITLTILFYAPLASGQLSATHAEMQQITSQLATGLNNNGFSKDLVVFDLTDYGGNQSHLGKHLTGIITSQLVNAPKRFSMVAQEEIRTGGGNVAGKFFNGAVNAVSNSEIVRERLPDDQEVLVDAAAKAVPGFFNPDPNRIKGADAYASGTVQDMGEHYFLNITVKDCKKGRLISTAQGQISKTESLMNLEGQRKNTVMNGPDPLTRGGGPARTVNPNHKFDFHHLYFELGECKRSGKYLTCTVNVISKGRNTGLSFCHGDTKVFNIDGNRETEATRVSIEDKHGGCWVRKDLSRDLPTESVLTFEPNEEINMINKLQINAEADDIGRFVIEFYEITVN